MSFQWPDISLVGKMGSGKDFVGARLVEELGYTRLALADALKEEVAALNGITVEQLNADKARYRRQLQEQGVYRRQQQPYYWVDEWAARRAKITGPVVCTDTRFTNEAEAFRLFGACLIRVVTPEDVRLDRLRALYGAAAITPAVLNHASEQEVDRLPVHYEVPGTCPAWEYKHRITGIVAGFTIFPQDVARPMIRQEEPSVTRLTVSPELQEIFRQELG